MQIALLNKGQNFVVPYELADFSGTIHIVTEQHMLEFFAESNQGKEALNISCSCSQGTAKGRKNYPRMTEPCSAMSRRLGIIPLLIMFLS